MFIALTDESEETRAALLEAIRETNIDAQHNLITVRDMDWCAHLNNWLGANPEDANPHLLPLGPNDLPLGPNDLFFGVVGTRFATTNSRLNKAHQPFASASESDMLFANRCYQDRGTPRTFWFRYLPQGSELYDLDLGQLQHVKAFFSERDNAPILDYSTPAELKQHATQILNTVLRQLEQSRSPIAPAQRGLGDLRLWLRLVRLSHNPFDTNSANAEQGLESFFSNMVPHFDEIAGVPPNTRQTMIVFGARGSGKTAIRRTISAYPNASVDRRRILCVSWTDFAPLAKRIVAGEKIGAPEVVEHLLILAIRQLGIVLADEQRINENINLPESQRRELFSYVRRYGRDLGETPYQAIVGALTHDLKQQGNGDESSRYIRAMEFVLKNVAASPTVEIELHTLDHRLRENLQNKLLYGDHPQLQADRAKIFESINWLILPILKRSFQWIAYSDEGLLGSIPDIPATTSHRELFHTFCRALRPFGFDTVDILIDQVDEEQEYLKTDEQRLDLLLPLLQDLPLLQPADGVATFRFFLPDHYRALLQQRGVRLDVLREYSISDWPAQALQALIKRRLEAARSPDGRLYTRLAEVPSEVPDLDEQLIAAINRNPRQLIILCDLVIQQHCQTALDEDDFLIKQRTVDLALASYRQTQPDTAVTPTQPTPPVPASTYDPIADLPTMIASAIVTYRNQTNDYQKVLQAVNLTQVTLQFVGCALLALYRSTGTNELLNQQLRAKLFDLQQPPSLGAWREAIDLLLATKLAAPAALLDPLVTFYKASDIEEVLDKLIEERSMLINRTAISSILSRPRLEQIDTLVNALIDALAPLGELTIAATQGLEPTSNNTFLHRLRLYRGNVRLAPEDEISLGGAPPVVYQRDRIVLYAGAPVASIELGPFVVVDDNQEPYLYESLRTVGEDQIEATYISTSPKGLIQRSDVVGDLRRVGLIEQANSMVG